MIKKVLFYALLINAGLVNAAAVPAVPAQQAVPYRNPWADRNPWVDRPEWMAPYDEYDGYGGNKYYGYTNMGKREREKIAFVKKHRDQIIRERSANSRLRQLAENIAERDDRARLDNGKCLAFCFALAAGGLVLHAIGKIFQIEALI